MPLPIARDVEAVMVIYFICSGLLLSGRIWEMQLLKALKKNKISSDSRIWISGDEQGLKMSFVAQLGKSVFFKTGNKTFLLCRSNN